MALMLVLMDNSVQDNEVPETEPKKKETIKEEFVGENATAVPLPSTCGICGDPHYYRDCSYVVINSQIPDKKVISRARLSLPDILKIKRLADETDSVFALNPIQAGTEFGPFIAKRNLTLHPSATFPIKVFTNNESDLSEYYLDSTDENECCWMMFVKPANDIGEQNLICYQENEDIYFGAIRDIAIGEELKVWYSPYFAYKMQKITLTFKDSDSKLSKNSSLRSNDDELAINELNKLIKDQQRIIPRAVWNCKFCSKLEKNVTDFAKHLLSHYVARKKNICKKCQIGFRCSTDYNRHLKLIHSDTVTIPNDPEIPLADDKQDKVKQKTSKQKNSNGEPLLTQYVSDNLDNSNSFLIQPEPNENIFELENYDNQTALFDVDHLRLNLDVIGSATIKDLDNLDVDAKLPNSDSNDFVCDICLKRFSSVRLVSLHLRFHAGQYFCSNCKRIFGRLENLKHHKCNSVMKHKCPQCNKLFYQKKYLTHHISVFHEKKFSCRLCGEKYCSSTELKEHCCKKAENERKTIVKCPTCGKIYNSVRGLNSHLHSHKLKDTDKVAPKHICSECSETFTSNDAYRRHATVKHGKPQSFDCRVCDKKFSRKDTLKRHILSAHMVDQTKMFQCPTCKKEFKVKHYLDNHIKQIHEYSKYYCELCNTSFKFSRNLQRHRKLIHNGPNFKQGLKCPVCNVVVKLKGSLLRHIRKKHPEAYKRQCADHQAKMEESRSVKYKCATCNKELKSEVALLRHIKTKHPEEGKTVSNRTNLHESVVEIKKIRTADEEFDNYMDLQKTIENMDFSIDTCNENLFSGSETIDRFIKERSDQISIFCADSPRITAPPVCDVSADKSNREVGLSMPDLSDVDPDVKLTRATPIGNNFESPFTINAIDDVVLYVLNEKGN